MLWVDPAFMPSCLLSEPLPVDIEQLSAEVLTKLLKECKYIEQHVSVVHFTKQQIGQGQGFRSNTYKLKGK